MMPSVMQISRAKIGRFTSLMYMWFSISNMSFFAIMSSTTLGIAGGAPFLAASVWMPLTTRKSLDGSIPKRWAAALKDSSPDLTAAAAAASESDAGAADSSSRNAS